MTLTLARAGHSSVRELSLPVGTTVRAALRSAGHVAEGCAVLAGPTPLPLDLALVADTHLTVIPTFSGG
ncbi:MAG TPA: hypothetical protein VFG07_01680 [Thermoplasmata archaeon]|nr:hypothetical protein [Thermoplasmata archaeon]